MAKQLEDLVGVRFTELSSEEQLAFLQDLRRSRRTPKATSKVVRSEKLAKQKATDKLDALFDSLTPEEQKAFLEGLQDGNIPND